jgi:tight adherence protein C
MTDLQWLIVAMMAAAGLLAALTAVVLLREARRRDFEARVLELVGRTAEDHRAFGLGGFAGTLHRIGRWIQSGTRLYSEKDLAALESLVATSGFNPRRILPLVLGGKAVLTVLIPAAALAYCYVAAPGRVSGILIISISIALGMLGPDWVLSALRRPHIAALQRGVIDGLDLLVVCSEAGLGLESALDRVAREMRLSNRPTAAALNGLLEEIRVLPDRRTAFANFAKRSAVDGLQRMATMLAQSLQYGTPLGHALRTVADHLRRERMIKLEEQAAKLPAKLVLPLICFVMPCLFIVLVGSSFLRLYDQLSLMHH